MRTLLIWLVFTSVFLWRWTQIKSPLPAGWQVGERVRVGIVILQEPEDSDSQTIIRSGRWYVPVKGYITIMPGTKVWVEGEPTVETTAGKVVRVKLQEDTIVKTETVQLRAGERLMVVMGQWRESWVRGLEQRLPEPHASLAAGILLGVRRRMPMEFYQQLVNTGTLHVVAASGFNVMVVGSALIAILSRWVGRAGGIVGGVGGIWLYVMLAGASASVVRAGVMGSLTLMAYYGGRVAAAKRLLGITAGMMLLFNPLYIVDVGFQLSVAATAGLLYIGPIFDLGLKKYDLRMIKEYLVPTLAASLATAPIILYHFGRVAWVSPLVNLLILPVVPLSMLLAALALIIPWASYVLYVPLWWIVNVITLFSN